MRHLFPRIESIEQRNVELLHERAPHHVRFSCLSEFEENSRNLVIVDIRRGSPHNLEQKLDRLNRLGDKCLHQ